jgi:L-arabinonolactonase
MEIERIGDIRCRLGEGPLWDAQEQALYWVDAPAATLHRIDWPTRAAKSWHMPGPNVGSLALRENGGAVIAMGRGFYTFDFETGEASLVQELLTTDQSVRFNDGKTDRQGRFVAGSMDLDEGEGRPIGVVYQLDSELQPTQILDGFGCFNGPCFSPDGKTFYCTGRTSAAIEAFDYDPDTGAVSNGRILIDDNLNCDGATVDVDGCLWSAQWSGAGVQRITPHGRRDRYAEVPGQCVSSVMFGGPDLDKMFVTTVSDHASLDSTSADAGSVFVLHGVGCQGIAERRFVG